MIKENKKAKLIIKEADKRAVSALIATVLLIGITIASFGIFYSAIIPFIKQGMDTSKMCGEAELEIDNSNEYTCYDDSTRQLQVMINRGSDEIKLSGMGILIRTNEISKRYDILQGSNPYVRMLDGEYGGKVMIPDANNGVVYVLNVDNMASKVEIMPLVNTAKGVKACDITNKADYISPCPSSLPLNFPVFKEQTISELNNRWGWGITGFSALRTNQYSTDGNYSLQVTGKGSAGFNPNIGIDKATALRFSYKKNNPGTFISIFYHIRGNGEKEWIEITDAPDRGYRGYTINHEMNTDWNTINVLLSNLQNSGNCGNFASKGVVDNLEFAVWNSTTVYFDNVYFY